MGVEAFLASYRASHQTWGNKACHAVGIPAILAGMAMAYWNWRWGLGLFLGGWVLQFLGHWIEGNPPAFLSNPIFLLVGPYWLLRRILRLKEKEPSA